MPAELIDTAFDRLVSDRGFVDRPSQRQLAHLISDCIKDKKRGAFEAPTGLGKSLATLIPAFAHAIASNSRTIVATYTNVLAEQYWRQDLPLARSLFDTGLDMKAQFLIGRQRYACKAAIGENHAGTLKDFLRHGKLGVESEFRLLTSKPPRELAQIWQAVATPPVCPSRLCPLYSECWYYGARKGAEKANVVITNHSVVIQDALLRQASNGDLSLLGEYDFLVLDEAHDFLQAAMNGLEFELSEAKVQGVVGIARRLQNTLQATSMDAGQPHIWNQECEQFTERLEKVASRLGDAYGEGILRATPSDLAEHPQVKQRTKRTGIEEAQATAQEIAGLTHGFVRMVEKTLDDWAHDGYAKPDDRDSIRNYQMFLREFAIGCQNLFLDEHDDLVTVTYAAGGLAPGERSEWARDPIVRRDIVHLAEPLQGLIWDKTPFACLSATLAVDGNFDFFRRMTGAEPDFEEILPTPFDYPSQAAVYVPPAGRIVDPARARIDGREDEYHRTLATQIEEILEVMQGRTLVLFHSRKEMDAVHRLMPPSERKIYIQRSAGAASTGEKFLADTSSSLFALRSFWTGFDAPGETLSCVVLVRIPFEVPVDPAAVARMAWLQSQGVDAFLSYSLPQAKTLVRQGAGRLIRKAEDKGVIALLDPRLRTKGYGEQIFENLPPGMRFFDDMAEAAAFLGL